MNLGARVENPVCDSPLRPLDSSFMQRNLPEDRLCDEAPSGQSRAPAPRWAHRLLVALVVQFLLLAGIQAWQDSLTVDEPFYISAGYTGLTEQDLRINFEHPPLPKLLAAVPAVLFGDVIVPKETFWDHGDTIPFAHTVIDANRDDLQELAFLFRVVPLLEGAAIGVLLYLIGRRLFGWRAGLVSASLWLTSPLAVGFSHLNGLDIPGALVLLLLTQLTLRYLERTSWARLGWLAMAAGVALLTRSGIGMIGMLAVLVVAGWFHGSRREWAASVRLALVPLSAWVVVWVTYWLLDPATSGDPTQPMLQALDFGVDSWWERVVLLPPWPRGFEAGIHFLASFHQEYSLGYLFGDRVEAGARFWAGSFVLKMTPIATLAIVAGLISWTRVERDRATRALLILGVPLTGWAVMMSQASRPFGVRFLIPGIVLLLVAAGPVERWFNGRGGLAVLGIAAVLQLGFLWQSHPHSLSWTAPFLGPGWQVATDANVDWGQDFYRLEDWAVDKDAPYISYFGTGPTFELSEIPNAVSAHPNPGGVFAPSPSVSSIPIGTEWVAMSASNLNSALGLRARLRDYCPVGIVGQTILIYRFEDDPLTIFNPRGDPRQPADPCYDAEFSTLTER